MFLDNGQYWGMISTVLAFDALNSELQKRAESLDMEFAVAESLSDSALEFVFGNPALVPRYDVSLQLTIPGRNWLLLAKGRTAHSRAQLQLLRVLAWGVALTIAALLHAFLKATLRQNETLQALHNSQLRLGKIITSAPQGMAIINADGHFLTANPSLCNTLGLLFVQLLQRNIFDLLPLAIHADIAELLQSVTDASHIHGRQFETSLKHSNHSQVAVILSLAPLQSQQQNHEWVVQILDISERKRLDKLKNDFVSSVSHELRTPLTSIIASLRLMNSGVLGDFNEKCKKIIQIAHQNGERLSLLINDLLDMDKLLAGKMLLDLQEHNLNKLVQQAVDINQAYAQQLNISLVYQAPDEIYKVWVDAARLQQVLTNLLSNAAKFSPAGSRVLVNIVRHDQQVRVEVIDQGIGIAAAEQANLFTKFYQVDGSSSRQKGGTGLGLAISKELMLAMNGVIGVVSEVGKGSCFYVDLPLK